MCARIQRLRVAVTVIFLLLNELKIMSTTMPQVRLVCDLPSCYAVSAAASDLEPEYDVVEIVLVLSL
jgi:hypothetical protein